MSHMQAHSHVHGHAVRALLVAVLQACVHTSAHTAVQAATQISGRSLAGLRGRALRVADVRGLTCAHVCGVTLGHRPTPRHQCTRVSAHTHPTHEPDDKSHPKVPLQGGTAPHRATDDSTSHHTSPYNTRIHTPFEHTHTHTPTPLERLASGQWVKTICGASLEDAAAVRDLSYVYTCACVDCIDVACEASVVRAAKEGIQRAVETHKVCVCYWRCGGVCRMGICDIAVCKTACVHTAYTLHRNTHSMEVRRPWLMVSVSDRDDVHFRKAFFDPTLCPEECTHPCESVCPAMAIDHSECACACGSIAPWLLTHMRACATGGGGVLKERCYGCGRCTPVCPYGLIDEDMYQRSLRDVVQLLPGACVFRVSYGAG